MHSKYPKNTVDRKGEKNFLMDNVILEMRYITRQAPVLRCEPLGVEFPWICPEPRVMVQHPDGCGHGALGRDPLAADHPLLRSPSPDYAAK